MPNINPPKLNEELAVAASVRVPDNRAVVIQSLIGHALTAALRLGDDLKTARVNKSAVDTKEALYKTLDVVTLLTTAFSTATKKRQDACKYAMDEKYKKVCAKATASTDLLFHDLQKTLKESSDESKISPFKKAKNYNRPPSGRGRGNQNNQYNRNDNRKNRFEYREDWTENHRRPYDNYRARGRTKGGRRKDRK